MSDFIKFKVKSDRLKTHAVLSEGKTRDQKDAEYNKRSREWFNRPPYYVKGKDNERSDI